MRIQITSRSPFAPNESSCARMVSTVGTFFQCFQSDRSIVITVRLRPKYSSNPPLPVRFDYPPESRRGHITRAKWTPGSLRLYTADGLLILTNTHSGSRTPMRPGQETSSPGEPACLRLEIQDHGIKEPRGSHVMRAPDSASIDAARGQAADRDGNHQRHLL